MSLNYQVVTTPTGEEVIKYELDGISYTIPCDLANSDYQRYLAWLENPEAEQSTPMIPGDE